MNIKKYVLAGASGRGYEAYALPLYREYSDCAKLCGVFDINRARSEYISQQCGGVPVYDNFDEMIVSEKPDCVIVTTVDAYHSDYVVRALELGCEVIVEKPMTIDAERCRSILQAEKTYGGKVSVIFNCRFLPFAAKLRELVKSGAIGQVYSVHFEWLLDRVMDFNAHGASYFRRWNARMEKSGGLLLHKSSHHFDLVCWVIDASPKKVSAFGKLNLYGKNGAFRGENCHTCAHTRECPFYHEQSEFDATFYTDAAKYDGYHRDGCVYSEEIDIYDTMAVNVLFDGGEMMSYSLNATAAYEGWRMSINGSLGRIEAFYPSTGFQANNPLRTIRVFDLNNNMTEHHVAEKQGTHGGADAMLREMLFRGIKDDRYGFAAGTEAGTRALMIGAAANLSIESGSVVDIDKLLER